MARKKIVLAHPSYGSLDAEINKALRVAIMSAADTHEWLGDVSTIREGWVGGRNRVVKSTLEDTEAEGILWVDDDVLLPPTSLKRLANYDEDFVTGLVFQKWDNNWPLVAEWKGTGMAWFVEFPENVLMKADGCGFGCCYTSTKMLRAIQSLPPKDKVREGEAYFTPDGWFDQFPPNWFGQQNGDGTLPMGEDFSFCMRAKLAGFQLYADTGLMCAHMIGPKYATYETFKKTQAKKKEKTEAMNARFAFREAEAGTFDVGGGFK